MTAQDLIAIISSECEGNFHSIKDALMDGAYLSTINFGDLAEDEIEALVEEAMEVVSATR